MTVSSKSFRENFRCLRWWAQNPESATNCDQFDAECLAKGTSDVAGWLITGSVHVIHVLFFLVAVFCLWFFRIKVSLGSIVRMRRVSPLIETLLRLVIVTAVHTWMLAMWAAFWHVRMHINIVLGRRSVVVHCNSMRWGALLFLKWRWLAEAAAVVEARIHVHMRVIPVRTSHARLQNHPICKRTVLCQAIEHNNPNAFVIRHTELHFFSDVNFSPW